MSVHDMGDVYPKEELDSSDDDGTIVGNVEELATSVVGHRIVAVLPKVEVPDTYYGSNDGIGLKLDNGKVVVLADTDDCCAYTEVRGIIPHLDKVDHVITGVGTTDEYNTWHIYCDLGDVLELSVGWSGGNLGYYGYGFNINVVDAPDDDFFDFKKTNPKEKQ